MKSIRSLVRPLMGLLVPLSLLLVVLGLLRSVEVAHASGSGTWTPTGSMTVTRYDHTATLLPNGQVLVAGGWGSSYNALASAELYDPSSGTWATTGSMAVARESHTATLLPNGQVLVAGGGGSNYNALASAELYTTDATAPTPTPSPTPTSTTVPSPTPTLSPTVTPSPSPAPGTTIAQDSFQRANQSLWGSASDGQSWGGDANSLSMFSISGDAGLVSNTFGSSYSAVLGPPAADAEVYATGSLSSFASSNFGDVLRWTDGNNWYKAFIDGSSLLLQKKVSGVTSILASVPFSASAGVSYTIHFRVVGSTLTANVWAASGSEPSGWMVTASDSTFTSGHCGMRFLTQTGTATVTSFQAKSL